MTRVKKTSSVIALLIVIVAGLWFGTSGLASRKKEFSSQTRASLTGGQDSDDSNPPDRFRTKAAIRKPAAPRATHSPQRLKEFMLPAVTLDGVSLDEALRKLMGVYEETCRKTGETPLALKFIVPPGNQKKLHLRLSGRNFTSSVQLLAALSGMKASRNELTYQFMPLIDERKPVSRSIQVQPDITSALSELAGQTTEAKNPFEAEVTPRVHIGELIRKLGLDLDPSTHLSLSASGQLNLETTSTADADTVSALIEGISGQMPLQHKFTSMVVDLAAGAEWTPPDVSQMTDSQLQLFMREMARNQGTNLTTLPAVTSRGGQGATIEMIREWIIPKDDSGEAFETHNVGQVMQLQGSPLGFGHDLAFNFTDTTAEVDPVTAKPTFNKRIDVKDSGFSSDNGTRLVVQTRPDGSRAIVLVTSSMIDATGRPIH